MNLFLVLLIVSSQLQAIFEHDRAVSAGQKGDWKKATSLLAESVADDPQNPGLLYDAGVASYKNGAFDQAQAYFDEAQKNAQDRELKEQALFNRGNTQVQQKKLSDAIASYEQALHIQPDDERARHNLEIVKKMLQEQQKKEQDQQDKKQKQNEEEKKNKQNKKDEQEKKQEDGAQSNEKKKSDDKQQEQSKEQNQKQDSNQPNKHDDQEKNESEEKEPEKAPENSAKNDLSKNIDAQLAKLLDQREKKDAALNKQLIKAQVGKQLTGYHGQNCW